MRWICKTVVWCMLFIPVVCPQNVRGDGTQQLPEATETVIFKLDKTAWSQYLKLTPGGSYFIGEREYEQNKHLWGTVKECRAILRCSPIVEGDRWDIEVMPLRAETQQVVWILCHLVGQPAMAFDPITFRIGPVFLLNEKFE